MIRFNINKTYFSMYSVEWQKCGLPYAHILVWLVDKIHPGEVDVIFSEPHLFQITC